MPVLQTAARILFHTTGPVAEKALVLAHVLARGTE